MLDAQPQNVNVFQSTDGVALPIDEATIDLSALITAAQVILKLVIRLQN